MIEGYTNLFQQNTVKKLSELKTYNKAKREGVTQAPMTL